MDLTTEFPADADRIVGAIAIQNENFVAPKQAGKRAPDIPALVAGDDNGAYR